MKQNQYSPMSVAEMGTVLFAANEGFLDDVDVDKVVKFEAQLLDWMRSEQKELLETIGAEGKYNDEIAAGLKAALEKFKTTQTW
jgi:F-type H+-transporting ATPase subunit alpha